MEADGESTVGEMLSCLSQVRLARCYECAAACLSVEPLNREIVENFAIALLIRSLLSVVPVDRGQMKRCWEGLRKSLRQDDQQVVEYTPAIRLISDVNLCLLTGESMLMETTGCGFDLTQYLTEAMELKIKENIITEIQTLLMSYDLITEDQAISLMKDLERRGGMYFGYRCLGPEDLHRLEKERDTTIRDELEKKFSPTAQQEKIVYLELSSDSEDEESESCEDVHTTHPRPYLPQTPPQPPTQLSSPSTLRTSISYDTPPSDISDSPPQVSPLINEVERLSIQLQQAKARLTQAHRLLSAVQDELNSTTYNHTQAQAEIRSLKRQLDSEQIICQKMEEENKSKFLKLVKLKLLWYAESVKERMPEHTQELIIYEDSNSVQETETEELRAYYESVLRHLESTLAETMEERNMLEDQMDDLQATNEIMDNELMYLTGKLAGFEQKMSSLSPMDELSDEEIEKDESERETEDKFDRWRRELIEIYIHETLTSPTLDVSKSIEEWLAEEMAMRLQQDEESKRLEE